MSNLQDKIRSLPHLTGVYIYKDKGGKIIYVGKSKNLRSRVSSYFNRDLKLDPKTKHLVQNIVDFDYIVTQSEVEAFLLEAELIKRYKPKYNFALKDDKNYKHIAIETFTDNGKNKVKRLLSVHKKYLKNAEYFGPYTDGTVVNSVLKALRRVFPYASCTKAKFSSQKRLCRPCIYGSINLCPKACINDKSRITNNRNIAEIKKFLIRGQSSYTSLVETKLKKYVAQEQFEKAIKLRDFLERIKMLKTAHILPDQYENNPNLINEIYKKRSEQIKDILGLEKTPERIECYDISNIMGQWAVGSMVVSENGKLQPNEYKRFKIKYTQGITDLGMMYEIIVRRVKHSWPVPDILLIDGGRGQVSTVLIALAKIPRKDDFQKTFVVGIFKPNDRLVYRNETTKRWRVITPKDCLGYQHLRELRDEAHRFAKKYHTKLRSNLSKT